MSILTEDSHTHTTWSDGAYSVREMAAAAYEAGLTCLGISDHSYASFESEPYKGIKDTQAYQKNVAEVALEYTGKLAIHCGIEQDFFSEPVEPGYEYVIGSVHYVEIPLELAEAAGAHVNPEGTRAFVSVDETEELFVRAAQVCFGGDYYAFAQAYFQLVTQIVEVTGADVIGHFDLFAKYNEGNAYFNESDVRYVHAWQKAADTLLKTGCIFEINRGAVDKGYRSVPYPAPEIQTYLKQQGARLIYTSDAHCIQFLRAHTDSAGLLSHV